jgi:hypothetical protein
MPDLFTDELVAALPLPGCSVCRVSATDDRRWMETWWREGRNSKEGRQDFYDGGGFCRRHAWLLHEICRSRGSGAAVAAVYGALAERDIVLLERAEQSISRRRRNRSVHRSATCSACEAAAEQLDRRSYFFVKLLRTLGARNRYVDSDGLCFTHLTSALDVSTLEDREVALFLLSDWRRRLFAVRDQLAEYDRKRDHRYSEEPKGSEQDSWTRVIDLYVGPPGT